MWLLILKEVQGNFAFNSSVKELFAFILVVTYFVQTIGVAFCYTDLFHIDFQQKLKQKTIYLF